MDKSRWPGSPQPTLSEDHLLLHCVLLDVGAVIISLFGLIPSNDDGDSLLVSANIDYVLISSSICMASGFSTRDRDTRRGKSATQIHPGEFNVTYTD